MRASFVACLLTLLIVLPVSAIAETNWPSFQAGLQPGRSISSVTAKLPDDISIVAPSRNVDRRIASYSGVRLGWMCRDAIYDAKLAVEQIDGESAQIVFAGASENVAPFVERTSARLINGELVAELSVGILTIALREDGNLNVRLVDKRNGGKWCYGILSTSIDDSNSETLTEEKLDELGLIKTGLSADYPDEVSCPEIAYGFAVYTQWSSLNDRHAGIDIKLPEGTPIHSIAAGEVIGIWDSARGNQFVAIQHPPWYTGRSNWTYSTYQHIQRNIPTKVGDVVVSWSRKIGQWFKPPFPR